MKKYSTPMMKTNHQPIRVRYRPRLVLPAWSDALDPADPGPSGPRARSIAVPSIAGLGKPIARATPWQCGRNSLQPALRAALQERVGGDRDGHDLSLIHISEPTRRT